MELINQAVIHKTFGEGKIISMGNGYITILFAQGEKKFMYPSAFKQFLSMKDSACTTFIQAEISTLDAKEAEAAEQKRLLAIQQQESMPTTVTTKDSKPTKKVKVFPRANIAETKGDGSFWFALSQFSRKIREFRLPYLQFCSLILYYIL